jgi:hypothetical protein
MKNIAACLVGITLLGISAAALLPPRARPTNFAAASSIVKADYQPSDIVYVPEPSMFWGMNRYIIGPDWGSPLDFADVPNERWQRVYDLLGPSLVARLGLWPKSNLVSNGPFRVLTGRTDLSPIRTARRIWLVTYFNREPPPASVYEGRNVAQEYLFGGMRLTLLVR